VQFNFFFSSLPFSPELSHENFIPNAAIQRVTVVALEEPQMQRRSDGSL
jgi:hypothetical protein